MKNQRYNFELENAVLSMPEFQNKDWVVQNATDYSVTLMRNKKDKTEKIVVYASYTLKL